LEDIFPPAPSTADLVKWSITRKFIEEKVDAEVEKSEAFNEILGEAVKGFETVSITIF
jgi:hypothetical protein